MLETHGMTIANQAGVTHQQVEAVRSLLDAGATIPFIARYRKEKTGSLDEVVLSEIRDSLARLAALESRRQAILKSLEEQDVLTAELKSAVESAATLTALEDIYLPYRPKRRTRATMAKEKGLEPLAELILAQEVDDPSHEALAFVNMEKGVGSIEDALAGARDIIAEWVNEDTQARQIIRRLFYREGIIQSNVAKDKEGAGIKYSNYFDWQEPVARVPSHRMLAMLRGENEGFLKLTIRPPQEKALSFLHRRFIKSTGAASAQVALAVEDSYPRLLAPSIETDIRQQAKERADDEALRVFAYNLRETLMAPPMGHRAVLAIDPGYRTGCKVVCLDPQGKLLDNTVIYVNQSAVRSLEASQTILDLIQRFHIEAIAIGNGTASRETEEFIRGLSLPDKMPVVMVNESGASIYSASTVAREEFPDQDPVDGTQIEPVPGDGRLVKFYVVVGDPNGIQDVAAVYVKGYHPDGSFKFQLDAIEPTWTVIPYSGMVDLDGDCSGDTAVPVALDMLDAQSRITYGYDPVRGNMMTLETLKYDLDHGKQFLVEIVGEMDYCQPAGVYRVEAIVVDQGGTSGTLENYFEYLSIVALTCDFANITWGNVNVNQWNILYDDEDLGTPTKPTVKNIGNDPAMIELQFTDMLGANFQKKISDFDALMLGGYIELVAGVPNIIADAAGVPILLPPCTPTQIDFSVHPPVGTPEDTYTGDMTITILHWSP